MVNLIKLGRQPTPAAAVEPEPAEAPPVDASIDEPAEIETDVDANEDEGDSPC